MKKLIVISDWVADGLRCQELRTIVEGYLNNPFHPYISFVASSHSSVHAGFLADQLAAVEERFGRPLETIIFVDLPEEIGFEAGKTVQTTVGELTCYNRLKDVPDAQAALIIGSSGYKQKRFLEVVVQGKSAAQFFRLKSGHVLFEE